MRARGRRGEWETEWRRGWTTGEFLDASCLSCRDCETAEWRPSEAPQKGPALCLPAGVHARDGAENCSRTLLPPASLAPTPFPLLCPALCCSCPPLVRWWEGAVASVEASSCTVLFNGEQWTVVLLQSRNRACNHVPEDSAGHEGGVEELQPLRKHEVTVVCA